MNAKNNTVFICPSCGGDLTQPKSVVRAFYVKGECTEVFAKAHYQPLAYKDTPAGTVCIDTHQDIEMDEAVHEDSDKCATCEAEICAERIKEYADYLSRFDDGTGNNLITGKPLEPYATWR